MSRCIRRGLKELMTRAPLLAFPDSSHDFLQEMSASEEGLGAVLAQKSKDEVQ